MSHVAKCSLVLRTVTQLIMGALGNWSFTQANLDSTQCASKAKDYKDSEKKDNFVALFSSLPPRDENAPALNPLYPSISLESWPVDPHRGVVILLFMISVYFERGAHEVFLLPVPLSWMKVWLTFHDISMF